MNSNQCFSIFGYFFNVTFPSFVHFYFIWFFSCQSLSLQPLENFTVEWWNTKDPSQHFPLGCIALRVTIALNLKFDKFTVLCAWSSYLSFTQYPMSLPECHEGLFSVARGLFPQKKKWMKEKMVESISWFLLRWGQDFLSKRNILCAPGGWDDKLLVRKFKRTSSSCKYYAISFYARAIEEHGENFRAWRKEVKIHPWNCRERVRLERENGGRVWEETFWASRREKSCIQIKIIINIEWKCTY